MTLSRCWIWIGSNTDTGICVPTGRLNFKSKNHKTTFHELDTDTGMDMDMDTETGMDKDTGMDTDTDTGIGIGVDGIETRIFFHLCDC